jgi:arabinose-5-phosphate isomerase
MMEPSGLPLSDKQYDDESLIAMGMDTFRQEAETLEIVGRSLGKDFAEAVRLLYQCQGRVLVTGLGKSGNVARKIAATLTSTGTPSHFIHPVEAAHGDLGVIRKDDILICLSRSGNNSEVLDLINRCAQRGMKSIAITAGITSEMATISDIVLHTPVEKEACPLDLTPTSSAVAAMAMGDALVVALIKVRGFGTNDFAEFHPSGALGRRLQIKVSDLMHKGDELPVVSNQVTLRETLPEIVGKRLGGVCVVDGAGKLAGLCVDGDIKRILLEREDALDLPITEAMNEAPTTITGETLAITALRIMEKRKEGPVTLLLVLDDNNKPAGLLHIHDVLRAGIL